MKQRLKPVTRERLVKKAGYWASVVTLGLIVGISLQLARANWTAPTTTAPNGNIGAPINTGNNVQRKVGGTLAVDNSIVAGIAGTNISTPPSPNGKPGNMYANDLWINGANNGTGQWASKMGGSTATKVAEGIYGYCYNFLYNGSSGGDCPSSGSDECRVSGSLMNCNGNVARTGTKCACPAGYTLVVLGDPGGYNCGSSAAYSCLKNN